MAGGETITDWGFVICGQRFGLVEYRGWSEHGDFGEMCTVLQLGRVKLLLASMEIYHVLPLICTAVVLFFSLGLFGLVKVPAFGLWLRSIVTVRTLLLSALVVAIGGSAFVGYWFSQPPQWQKICRGMSQHEVLVSMPDWVADMHCTDRSDWVHRDRYLLGFGKKWIMRVTYDDKGRVLTAETASIGFDHEGMFPSTWAFLPLP